MGNCQDQDCTLLNMLDEFKCGVHVQLQSQLYNGQVYTFDTSINKTVSDLKQHIYEKVVTELPPKKMTLFYLGSKLQNSKKLSDYKILDGTSIIIEMQKIKLTETSHIKGVVIKRETDEITLEDEVAIMPCGHKIGKDCMVDIIRSIIQKKQFEIRCPYMLQNKNKCNMEWNFQMCLKIGILSASQTLEFETYLSQNYIKKIGKPCPNPQCQLTISKGDLTHDRVVCTSCGYQFCYFCSTQWNSDEQYCNSQQCKFLDQFITKSPWTRIFKFNINGVSKEVKTPKERSCPFCKEIVENIKDCKHTKCIMCGHQFCWVCLSIPDEEGYPCGGAFDYCGRVAPIQILSSGQRRQMEEDIILEVQDEDSEE